MPTKRHACSNVRKSGQSCIRPARWEYWDPNKGYMDSYYYACGKCLSGMLDPDITHYIQRIVY